MNTWSIVTSVILVLISCGFYLHQTLHMAHLARMIESNRAISLAGKSVMVVGGTGGIGAASAVKFASLGASVTIAGRNKVAAETVIQKMRNESKQADAQFDFRPIDTTIMADIKRFSKEYYAEGVPRLDLLVVSAGGLNSNPRHDTSEGIEWNFAISYLGRFLVIHKLLPALLKSDNARVLTVLSAGLGGPIDNFDDIQMKEGYGKMKSAKYNSMANELMVQDLATKNAGKPIAFYHLEPGAVSTDLLRNSGFGSVTSWIGDRLVGLIGQTPEQYAETLTYIATSEEFGPAKSGAGVSSKAKVITPHEFTKQPGVHEKLFEVSRKLSGLDSE